jgi:hypothetical protein
MKKSKKYLLYLELQKYPYCAQFDNEEDYLSDKIC